MKKSSTRRRRSGFTLIEVLLVLVILVFLASMVVLAIGPIQKGAKIKQARIQIGSFKGALERWKMDIGTYPAALELLSEKVPAGDLRNPAKWQGPYLGTKVPPDPWDNDYQYQVEDPGNSRATSTFRVWSIGPDQVDGTEDDIGNWGTE